MTTHLQDFKDTLAMDTFGMTTETALEKGLCIQCNEEALPRCYSPEGWREYRISGLCEECFDALFEEGEGEGEEEEAND